MVEISIIDRDILIQMFLIYGFGKNSFHKIKNSISIPISLEEIQSIYISFLKASIPYCNTQEQVKAKKISIEIFPDFSSYSSQANTYIQRIFSLYILDLVIRYNPRFSILLEENLPISWWELSDDIVLMNGFYTYGYAQYDRILTDASFRFTNVSNSSLPFPSFEQLNTRFDTLMEYFSRHIEINPQFFQNTGDTKEHLLNVEYNSAQSLNFNHLNQKKNLIIPPTESYQHGWKNKLKNQRNDFIKALMLYGIQYNEDGSINWENIKQEVEIPFAWDSVIESAYHEMINECEAVSNLHDLDTHRPNHLNECHCHLCCPSFDDSDNTSFQLPSIPPMTISTSTNTIPIVTARKLNSRLSLFRMLRKNLFSSDNLMELIHQLCPPNNPDLPFWWNWRNDYSLCIAINKHGLNWDEIWKDDSISWYMSEEDVFSFENSINDDSDDISSYENISPSQLNDVMPSSQLLTKRFRTVVHTLNRYLSEKEPPRPYRFHQYQKWIQSIPPNSRIRGMPYKVFCRSSDQSVILPQVLAEGFILFQIGFVLPSISKFHSRDYIFPVDYCSVCLFPSYINKNSKCKYKSDIIIKDNAPFFRVTCSDDPTHPFESTESPAQVWKQIENRLGNVGHTIDGFSLFGLNHPVVVFLIQLDENAQDCTQYRWRVVNVEKFIVDTPEIDTNIIPKNEESPLYYGPKLKKAKPIVLADDELDDIKKNVEQPSHSHYRPRIKKNKPIVLADDKLDNTKEFDFN